MELVVNSIVGLVLLVFDVVQGLLGWADRALLTGAAVAVGTYLGMRFALTHHRV
jgi:hypothetical protein